MSKFTEWLKFYFIGFFTHTLSKEGADRSFFNTLLSFVLTFIIVSCGLMAGYAASFGAHYNRSDDFRTFLYSAFAGENSSERIDLSVKDGALSATVKEGGRVNTLLGEGEKYAVCGYQLIVDTRDAATNYAEFSVQCKKADGSEISYDAYRALTDGEKSAYSLAIVYSGKGLDPAAGLSGYEAFLTTVTTPGNEGYREDTAADYAKLKSDLSGGGISDAQYADGVYELYYRTYYGASDGAFKDAYGNAPTLKSYYLSPSTYEEVDKYIAVLDDVCFCAFETNGGLVVEFSGYFNRFADGVISGDGLSEEQMKSNVDDMLKSSFYAAGGLNFLVYIISLSRSVAMFVMAIILISLLAFMALKISKAEDCPRYIEAIKIVGSFVLWSALITFALTFVLSFFFERGAVFNASEIIIAVVLALRTAVYVVVELIADKKKKDAGSRAQENEQSP